MSLTAIGELISTLGLPIVLVIVMGWFIWHIYKDTTAQATKREDKLYQEIEKNREINSKAIETIGMYAERLTHIETTLIEVKDDVAAIKQHIE